MGSIYAKLLEVQTKLKAPKGQYNSFGKYKYRSCEDILEALKPVLKDSKATVHISDEVTTCEDWHYIKATATFADLETNESISVSAFARESKEKKGMDESQITGTASSYARKYALNGLFLIDDTKDDDTDESKNERTNRTKKQEESKSDEEKNAEMVASVDPKLVPSKTRTKEEMKANIEAEMKRTGINEKSTLATMGIKDWSEITDAKYVAVMGKFKKQPTKESK